MFALSLESTAEECLSMILLPRYLPLGFRSVVHSLRAADSTSRDISPAFIADEAHLQRS
jgi:hypothetical protein